MKSAASESKKVSRSIPSLARVFAQGGIMYLPRVSFLRRLQAIYATGNVNAYTDASAFAIANLLLMPQSQLPNLLTDLLILTRSGRSLAGLEGVLLTVLHALSESRQYAVLAPGLAVWDKARIRPAKNLPTFIVERKTGIVTRFDAKYLQVVKEILTPKTIVNRGVFAPLRNLTPDRVDQNMPGLHLSSFEAGMDCEKKAAIAGALIGLGLGLLVGGAVAGASKPGDSPVRSDLGTLADGAGVGGAVGSVAGALWAGFGCKSSTPASGAAVDPNANATSIDQIVFGENGVVTNAEMNELLDSVTGPAGDDAVPIDQGIQDLVDWATSPSDTPAPNSETDDGTVFAQSDTTTPDEQTNTQPDTNDTDSSPPPSNDEGTPTPDGEGTGWPPSTGTPDPDGTFGGGSSRATFLPNGGAFLTTPSLVAMNASRGRVPMAVSATALSFGRLSLGSSFVISGLAEFHAHQAF